MVTIIVISVHISMVFPCLNMFHLFFLFVGDDPSASLYGTILTTRSTCCVCTMKRISLVVPNGRAFSCSYAGHPVVSFFFFYW